MRALELADLLAVAVRVQGEDAAAVVARADLEAAEATLAGVRRADDVPAAAAVLLSGLVRRRPFHGLDRRVAVAATLVFVGLNGWDLDLGPPGAMDPLLDQVAVGDLLPPKLTEELRARLRPLAGTRTEEDEVFERFTDRARSVIVFAQEEARELGHDYIGTEHLLLGLLREGEGVAARALQRMDVSANAVRTQVEEIVGRGNRAPSGHIPFTPRAKKVLELALREATHLRHDHLGTEHVLLGVIREGEGVATKVLVRLGADPERLREEVLDLAGVGPAPAGRRERFGTGTRRRLLVRELNAVLDENERLAGEVDRLRELLRSHGIDPDAPTQEIA